MKTKLFLALALVFPLTSIANDQLIQSPDGKMAVTVSDEGGKPQYAVSLNGKQVIQPSPLGLKMNFDDLTQGLTLKGCDVQNIKDEYWLRTTKQSLVKVVATEAVCHFVKADANRPSSEQPVLDIIFHVTGRDVAFRYKIFSRRTRGGETMVGVVENEASGFVLPDGTTTFLCPQSKPMGGFARTSPSYETSYTLDDEAGKNGWGEGYTFPCLFKTPSVANQSQQTWVLISETGTDGGYVGCRLLNDVGTKYKIGFPQPGELNGIGSTTPAVSLPALTPWRTITIGETLAPIVETTIANDLVRPKYQPSKEYTYGKGSWSWIIGMDSSCNFDEQKRYIDFSAAMGWRSVLIDAFWDKQIGYEKMAELARYGREKGVGIFLWYNSNGSWNDAPQTPIGKMDKSSTRRKEMAWMQQNGILGIKVDFFGGDKQPMMQLYEDILTDANEFGLQVIFHGCTLPRGWERMYPNYVASEAVLASENLHFGQGACDAEARNACTHPFIRNTVGSMDFGGSTLNKHYNADNQHGTTRRTSDVFALATAVLFQSSVQHFAMAPNNLTDAPAWAVQFMKDVPTTWDEVKFIDGYPGKYIIMARRSGQQWYIAGINAQKDPVTTKIDLKPFFKKGTTITTYTDDAQLNGSTQTSIFNLKPTTVTIPENGGVVITGTNVIEAPSEKDMAAYLMVYFKEYGHNIYFAVSRDGRTFTDVNNGDPVMTGDTLALQKGIRDPHIYRGPDGAFYMALTDLHIYAKQEGLRDTEWEREGYGWGNNRALVLMKSNDLINWKRTNLRIDLAYPELADIGCAWAPATIYDDEAHRLMLSFTMRFGDGTNNLYYAYVNDDYDRLLTCPRPLFRHPNGAPCIDSDITHVGDKYHLYFVSHEETPGIKHAVSNHANRDYVYEPQWCDPEKTPCEAPTLWKMIGRDEYVLMYDVYSIRPNNMGFSATSDFKNYTDLGHFNDKDMKTTNFQSPKHGAVIQITENELQRLQKRWKFKL